MYVQGDLCGPPKDWRGFPCEAFQLPDHQDGESGMRTEVKLSGPRTLVTLGLSAIAIAVAASTVTAAYLRKRETPALSPVVGAMPPTASAPARLPPLLDAEREFAAQIPPGPESESDRRWKIEEGLTRKLTPYLSLPVGEPISLFRALRPDIHCTQGEVNETLCTTDKPGLVDCPTSAACTAVTYFFEADRLVGWRATYPGQWWDQLYNEAKGTLGPAEYGGRQSSSTAYATAVWRRDGLELAAMKTVGLQGQPVNSAYVFAIRATDPPGVQ